jgi:AcrR family transcriptional regulator
VLSDKTDENTAYGRRISLKALATEKTRAAIIEAATVEFADKGLAGARVDEIGRQTETSKHMLYYHFGNKDGLYQAVLEHAYANLRLAEEQIDYDALDPVNALESLVALSFNSHVNNPAYVRLIVAENVNCGVHIRHIRNIETRRAVLDLLRKIISRGAAQGIFRGDIDPLHLHMTISALSFTFVANRYTFGHIFGVDMTDPDLIAERRKHIVDAVLRICVSHDH